MREQGANADVGVETITVHGYGPGQYPDGFPADTQDAQVPESAVREVLDPKARYMIRQGRDCTGAMWDLRKLIPVDLPAMADADCAWFNSRTMRWEKIPNGYACAPRAPPPSDQDVLDAYRRHAAYMMAQAKDDGDVDDDEETDDDDAGEPASAQDLNSKEGYASSDQRGAGEGEQNSDEEDARDDVIADEFESEGEWGSSGNWGTDPAFNDIVEFEGSGSNYSADARQKKRQQERDRKNPSRRVEYDTEEEDLEDDLEFLNEIAGNAGEELGKPKSTDRAPRRKFSEEEQQKVDDIASAIRYVAAGLGRTPIAVMEATGLLPPSYGRSANGYNVFKAWITTRPECPPGKLLTDYCMLNYSIDKILGDLKTFTKAVHPMYLKAIEGLDTQARKAVVAEWMEDIESAEKYQVADVDKRMQRAILQLKPLVNHVYDATILVLIDDTRRKPYHLKMILRCCLSSSASQEMLRPNNDHASSQAQQLSALSLKIARMPPSLLMSSKTSQPY